MSMDFSQIKAITIPEGSVKKITDYQGNIIWEKPKQKPEWHTIWEGSKDIGAYKGTKRGEENNFAQCANGTGYTPLIRVTFSNLTATSGIGNPTKSYIVNDTTIYYPKPSSPQEMTLNVPETPSSIDVLSARVYYSGWGGTSHAQGLIWAKRDTSNNRVIFNATVLCYGGDVNYYTAGFTLTKIEQYY